MADMQVNEYAQPFHSDYGRVGVLFCHGFTASPWSLLEWAKVTADAGYRVSLPRLPGHGTCWQELNTTGWQDWYACVEREYLALRRSCGQVFVGGLSLGGALALRLAQKHEDVAGLLLVNPAIQAYPQSLLAPLLAGFIPKVKAIGSDAADPKVDEHAYDCTPLRALTSMMQLWADVRACLDLVTCPVLLFRSRVDHVVPPASARAILAHISSTEITERILENSYHVATMDYDKELVFTDSLDFLAGHTKN
jgi:carboxylesterase